jgi:hypothetical protein
VIFVTQEYQSRRLGPRDLFGLESRETDLLVDIILSLALVNILYLATP